MNNKGTLDKRKGTVTFSSNAKLVQHYFKELLSDGQEHPTREIKDYIYDKTGSIGIDGNRLTATTVDSAVWYITNIGKNTGHMQTRKGFFQKLPSM